MNEANCSRANCPQRALLDSVQAICGPCAATACDTCQHRADLERARAACVRCPRGGRPAGRGGTVSAEAAGEGVLEWQRAPDYTHEGRGNLTSLPEHIEERLEEVLRVWLNLDTMDYLLAYHTANGGTLDTFGAYLLRVRAAIDALRPSRPAMRATAWCRFQRLKVRFPICDKVRAWAKGNGGAKKGDGLGRTHRKGGNGKAAAAIRAIGRGQV